MELKVDLIYTITITTDELRCYGPVAGCLLAVAVDPLARLCLLPTPPPRRGGVLLLLRLPGTHSGGTHLPQLLGALTCWTP
jgi:hypothetical protein